ncbi:hypothetical protein TELCIR_05684 [Teladorsagia circumcincta]|uniref:Uncharacterized protein n=1 Tax=Teladorsagia circumcincta TaxID=45464 RepID=A0A2G9UQ79_TELCI|nr:hypothetical protein TELCIR_05684 [Teladorsagia circumcincta]
MLIVLFQETLIVWSESDTCDLALSFQEKSGCEEIWAKICEVQGRDPGDSDGGYDEMDDGELSEGSSNALSTTGAAGRVILPPIEIGRLSEVDSVIQNHLATQALREKMANAVESESVLPKLVDVFHMCEDVEHKDGLRTLYSIAKNLFMLNRNSLNETLLSDKYLKDLIGMLEYDPAHEAPRKHREFLYEKATFREVLPIANDELKEKIHQTYRVQYLQDVCLPAPSLFEENLLSVLNSYLFFNRIDIVNMLQKDKRLMKELFDQLRDPETTVSRRRDLAFFLKEFISLSQGLPPNGAQSKDNFFKEDIKPLVKYTVENHMSSFEDVTYVKLFSELKIRYEQQRDRENSAKITADERVPSPAAFAKERQEEQWFDGEDDDSTECKKEPIEVKKEIKKEIDSPRKTGIEPMFPSVLKRKNAFDEDDGAVFSGQVALLTPVNIVTEKKIVIKVGDRSRTPSPLGSPLSSTPPPSQAREDEVSSSQNNSKENSPMSIKSLVDYDESDSDEDENSGPNDSIPSSSTGSPVQMSSSIEKGAESTTAAPATSSGGDLSPCDDDVSSTSGEEESAAGGCGLTRRKRPSRSDIDEEVVKRSRASPET